MASMAELISWNAVRSPPPPLSDRTARLAMELRRALVEEEFALVYQPMVHLQDERVTCCEALLRWHHPVRGLLAPGEFLAAAEDAGLMPQIGGWVLREALAEARMWPNDISVAVNLSPAQLAAGDLADQVKAALTANRLPPSRLELEVTETISPLDNRLRAELQRLRELGVRLSIDDFGIGHSSLARLRSFAFDKIKIDRSFVSGLPHRAASAAIVRAIVGLGRDLGITTTAEGGETWLQVETLRALGCTELQGFFYSAGRPNREIREFLCRSRMRRTARPAAARGNRVANGALVLA
jgi:EAL domain-containing protein (putative c-di-GMP-specific phosphodiesterase class I)